MIIFPVQSELAYAATPRGNTQAKPFDATAAHFERFLDMDTIAPQSSHSIPDSVIEAARARVREALDQQFSCEQAVEDFLATVLQQSHLATDRYNECKSLVLGLRQLLIIRDLGAQLPSCSFEQAAAMARHIADAEMQHGTLLDAGRLGASIQQHARPWVPLTTTFADRLRSAFEASRREPERVMNAALSMLLDGGNPRAQAIEAALRLLEEPLTSARHEAVAARDHLRNLENLAAHHADNDHSGVMDRRQSNYRVKALRAELHALRSPGDAKAMADLIEARDRLQSFEQRRATPKDVLKQQRDLIRGDASAAAPENHPEMQEARAAPAVSTWGDLLQRIDDMLQFPPGAEADPNLPPRPVPCDPGTLLTPAGHCVPSAESLDAPFDASVSTQYLKEIELEKEVLNAVRAHVPGLAHYLEQGRSGSAAALAHRLGKITIKHQHADLFPLRVANGLGAEWKEVDDDRYTLLDLFRDARHNTRAATFFEPAGEEHVAVVATDEHGIQSTPEQLNTPAIRRELAVLLKQVATRTQPGQTPWMQTFLNGASPQEVLAVSALRDRIPATDNATLTQRADAQLRMLNQELQDGWRATTHDPQTFIQEVMQKYFGAPKDLLSQQISVEGWAKVASGAVLNRGHLPFHFSYHKPLAWAVVRTPGELCDQATIVDLARTGTQSDVHDARTAEVTACTVHWPEDVTGNEDLREMLSDPQTPAPVMLRTLWDASFRRNQLDADYQASLAQQMDVFMATKLDDIRLQRNSSTLAGVPVHDRAHYAEQAAQIRNGTLDPLLLAVDGAGDVADRLILLPGRYPDTYLAVPVGMAVPARSLAFGRNAFAPGLHLDNSAIDWLKQFFAPQRLQEGALNTHSSSGFAGAWSTGGDGHSATRSTTQSPTRFRIDATADPIRQLCSALQLRYQHAGQAVLRTQDEIDASKWAQELEEASEVMAAVAVALPFGELLLPELLAANEVEIAVVEGGVRLLNYGSLGVQAAAGWETMNSHADNPVQAQNDADNLFISCMTNLLLLAPDFLPTATPEQRLAAAGQQAEATRARIGAPISSGQLQGAHQIGNDLYIPLQGGKLHRAEWDSGALGFRLRPAQDKAAQVPQERLPLYRWREGRFQRVDGGAVKPPAKPKGGNSPGAASSGTSAAFQLPADVSRTPIAGTPYVRYTAQAVDGTASSSEQLVVSAHGTYFVSESIASFDSRPVTIPADLDIHLAAPHEAYLMDAGLDTFVNPPDGYSPYLSLRMTDDGVKIINVAFVPQPHSQWHVGADYDPAEILNTLGRRDGLQNYRHHAYEDSEKAISDALQKNRQLAAQNLAKERDVLVIDPDEGIYSADQGKDADTGVQRVLDMHTLGTLTNASGQKYRSIFFAHCRNLPTHPESSTPHYYITAGEVADAVAKQASNAAAPGAPTKGGSSAPLRPDGPIPTVQLVILHREDVNQPFEVRRINFVPLHSLAAAAIGSPANPPAQPASQSSGGADTVRRPGHPPPFRSEDFSSGGGQLRRGRNGRRT